MSTIGRRLGVLICLMIYPLSAGGLLENLRKSPYTFDVFVDKKTGFIGEEILVKIHVSRAGYNVSGKTIEISVSESSSSILPEKLTALEIKTDENGKAVRRILLGERPGWMHIRCAFVNQKSGYYEHLEKIYVRVKSPFKRWAYLGLSLIALFVYIALVFKEKGNSKIGKIWKDLLYLKESFFLTKNIYLYLAVLSVTAFHFSPLPFPPLVWFFALLLFLFCGRVYSKHGLYQYAGLAVLQILLIFTFREYGILEKNIGHRMYLSLMIAFLLFPDGRVWLPFSATLVMADIEEKTAKAVFYFLLGFYLLAWTGRGAGLFTKWRKRSKKNKDPEPPAIKNQADIE